MLKILFEDNLLTVQKTSNRSKAKSIETIFFKIACEIDNDGTEQYYKTENVNDGEIKQFLNDIVNMYCIRSMKVKNKVPTIYCEDKEKQQKVIDLLNSFIIAQKLIGGKK